MTKEKELAEFRNYIQDTTKIFKELGESVTFIIGQPNFNLSYLNYQLLKHSKRLGRLTTSLIFLTIILSVLAAWNIWLLSRLSL